jgi:hypothetical protein
LRKLYLLLAVALALSVSGAVFADEHGSGSGKMHEAMAKLEMVDNSGYHGEAHLKDMGNGKTHVKVHIEGMSEGMSMPAHIHMGSMDNYDEKPKYALNNVENGMSETMVEVSLEKLLSEKHVIAVHESEENVGNIVAVGDIHKMMGMPETGAGGMADSRNSAPVAGLVLVGAVLAAGALMVTRSRSI